MVEKIQVLKPLYRTDEVLEEIRACLEIGWTGAGFKTDEIEEKWRDYTGLPYSHFLNSATAGLHLALAIYKMVGQWEDGDEVITNAVTFVSTNHAIKYERLTPVFADIDDYGCLDPASVESRITDRTRAVIFVGLGGSTGQLAEVAEICARRGLKLILDAAHMAGAQLNDKSPGLLADCTVFSFQAVKNMPTADSGMICFSAPAHDQLARQMSWLGIDKSTFDRFKGGVYRWRYDVPNVGFKYHGNSIMAAVALISLKYLDEDNARRREISARYQELLAGTPNLAFIPVPDGLLHSRHLFQVRVKDRTAVIAALQDEEIYPGVHYAINSEYRPYRDQPHDLAKSEAFCAETISLPLHLHLTEADIEKVAAVVRKTCAAMKDDD